MSIHGFALSIDYLQHEYQIIDSSQFRSSFVNKESKINKRFKAEIFKNNINNLGELKSIAIVDLSWDTKTLDINQLENAN